MKNFFLIFNSLVTFLFSTIVIAHPGHDHNHWLSEILHSIILAAIAVVLAFGIDWLIKKLSSNGKSKKRNNNHAA